MFVKYSNQESESTLSCGVRSSDILPDPQEIDAGVFSKFSQD
jgi:hypothetical protein